MDSGGGSCTLVRGSGKFPTAKFITANLTWREPPPPLYGVTAHSTWAVRCIAQVPARRECPTDMTVRCVPSPNRPMALCCRPGVSAMASALAVELMAACLQHPLKGAAPADKEHDDATSLLGLVPHQIRCVPPRPPMHPTSGQSHQNVRCKPSAPAFVCGCVRPSAVRPPSAWVRPCRCLTCPSAPPPPVRLLRLPTSGGRLRRGGPTDRAFALQRGRPLALGALVSV